MEDIQKWQKYIIDQFSSPHVEAFIYNGKGEEGDYYKDCCGHEFLIFDETPHDLQVCNRVI